MNDCSSLTDNRIINLGKLIVRKMRGLVLYTLTLLLMDFIMKTEVFFINALVSERYNFQYNAPFF